jgi:hypothetical protein
MATRLGRKALGLALFAALIAGCDGAEKSTSVLPQGTMNNRGTARWMTGKSWMLPEAKHEDLLYTSDDEADVLVYSYPRLTLVGQLSGFGTVATEGLCVDNKGDIFVPSGLSNESGYVYEFSHGGISPIATLDDPGWGAGCSVDPRTGNLAVANYFSPNDPPYYHGDIAIYADAQGTPTTYTSPYIYWYWWAAYDDKGDLFVDGNGYGANGFPLAELPAGGTTFDDITLNKTIDVFSLQWSKRHLIISGGEGAPDVLNIYRVAVSGTKGTIVGTTSLRTHKVGYDGNGQFWIQGNRIIGAGRNHLVLDLWRYPSGGSVLRKIAKHFSPWGVVVSIAQGKNKRIKR